MKLPKISVKKMDVDAFLEPLTLVVFYLLKCPDIDEEISDKLLDCVLASVNAVGGNEMMDTFSDKCIRMNKEFEKHCKKLTDAVMKAVEDAKDVYDT